MAEDGAEKEAAVFKPHLEAFIEDNRKNLDQSAIDALRGLDLEDQRRILARGPIPTCDNPAAVIRSRTRAARETDDILVESVQNGQVSVSSLVRKATDEETDMFISQNRMFMDEQSIAEFKAMSASDRWRAMQEGELHECRDAGSIITARVRRHREMEGQVEEMMRKNQSKKKQPDKKEKPPPDPLLAVKLQNSFINAAANLQEVPQEERRFAAAATASTPAPDPDEAKSQLPASDKIGIGGVVEILAKKYGLQKGQRLRVVGESGGPAGLWKLEGEKTIPKTQQNQGWKWAFKTLADDKKKVQAREWNVKTPAAATGTKTTSAPAAEQKDVKKTSEKDKKERSRSRSVRKEKPVKKKSKARDASSESTRSRRKEKTKKQKAKKGSSGRHGSSRSSSCCSRKGGKTGRREKNTKGRSKNRGRSCSSSRSRSRERSPPRRRR